MTGLTEHDLTVDARLLYHEATARGVHVTILGNHTFLMRKQGVQWYVHGSRTSLQSSIGYTVSKKKHVTKAILAQEHVPTANWVTIKTADDLDQLTRLTFPLVVKPSNGKGGRHVVVGVSTPEEVARLYERFEPKIDKEEGIFLLAEEMLCGHEYRILCVDYTFVGATYRKPAHVVGDGYSSIQALVEAKNAHPWRGAGHAQPLTRLSIDDTVQAVLHAQGYTVTTVPAEGVEVYLRRTANLSMGGEPWNVTHQMCAENIALCEHIARVCDLNTIGIDLMCSSLSLPIQQQPRAGVIEINSAPALRMHHFPVHGDSINAAGKILDMVLTHLGLA
ncbi:MAG: hypothetical protein OEU26_02050 [Candidatus Tectomicrobia bacterium]|nr:hypothetical protein [Candidatus Tectomicrobia bacterium]